MTTYATFNEARTAYIEAADWEVTSDLAKAKQTVVAINTMFAFASAAGTSGGQGSQNYQLDFQQLAAIKERAMAFVSASDTPSDATLLNNPSVTHADFSGFHRYQ
jgi:hypothetical protein